MWALKYTALAMLVGITPSPTDQEHPQDDTQVLDGVTVEGNRLSPDIERTGTLLFRPLLTPVSKRDPLTRTERVDFIFSPVILDETGTARAYTDDGRTRFVSSLRVPQANETGFATNFNPKISASKFKAQSTEVPGGTYVLSEIVYSFAETQVIGRFNGFGGPPPRTQQEPASVRYCLSDGTFLLDVENETTQFIGAIALADLPRNRARHPDHTPIIALNRDLAELNLSAPPNGDLVAVDMDASKFISSDDMCTADAHHVAGW